VPLELCQRFFDGRGLNRCGWHDDLLWAF
jgi:hypothetical protein